MANLKGASEIPIGGMIIQAGSSQEYKTGAWASRQPKLNVDNCTGCMMCVNYCPDDCMTVIEVDGKLKVTKIDYDYCKGCGVCVAQCQFNAITMED